jgi:aminoglycoside phosphotransferase (APT) family kinase protein
MAAIDDKLVAGLVADQFPAWSSLAVTAIVPGGWDHRSEGEPLSSASGVDPERLARNLAGFLRALYRIEAREGPLAGEHFFRGGPVATYFRGAGRRAFRRAMAMSDDTWARARGWALWKALIVAFEGDGSSPAPREAQRVLGEVLSDGVGGVEGVGDVGDG